MENVITLGKLIGLLFLFCPSPLYYVFENFKIRGMTSLASLAEPDPLPPVTRYARLLAGPVMGTIFLVLVQRVVKSRHRRSH